MLCKSTCRWLPWSGWCWSTNKSLECMVIDKAPSPSYRNHFLELRIPPPVVGLIAGAGMWAVAQLLPILQLPALVRLSCAMGLAVIGVAVAIGGVINFRRARTTVNPLKPETSASLVTGGVYSLTRNPMYLGMLLVLFAWAVYLSSLWSLVGPMFFALYITRFQIVPEERVLDKLFGAAFSEYSKRVRRWV
jgi:protein-S-isoprenylcysteine O-methyltransferase Ste14